MEPKLHNVNKATPPYKLNKFPTSFIYKLGRELVYIMATRDSNSNTFSLEGSEWESIFATCIGAVWKPSNVGLDDVILGNCCWGAKTVKAGTKHLKNKKTVRLISGRNSITFSYDEEELLSKDPNELGKKILGIWNERVSSIKKDFKFVRTVVLIKGQTFDEFAVFEFDTIRYEPELYYFKRNKNKNIEGFDKATNKHCFTWQHSGSQFTLIEDIPKDRVIFSVKKPPRVPKETILEMIEYSKDWVTILNA